MQTVSRTRGAAFNIIGADDRNSHGLSITSSCGHNVSGARQHFAPGMSAPTLRSQSTTSQILSGRS